MTKYWIGYQPLTDATYTMSVGGSGFHVWHEMQPGPLSGCYEYVLTCSYDADSLRDGLRSLLFDPIPPKKKCVFRE